MKTLQEIKLEITEGKKAYYTYLLFKPDGTPIYVGKGCSNRIGAHEAETRSHIRGKIWKGINNLKISTIKKIWDNDGQVLYKIDSWHDTSKSSYDREIELIEHFGKRILNEGTLTNIRDGGDVMTEEDRRLNGEKIKQFYIDHPEARDKVSSTVKQYCSDNPDFIETLQEEKNRWIEECPEEYEEAKKKRREIGASEKNRKQTSETLKKYFADNPDVVEKMSKDGKERFESEESRERAKQNAIDCKSHEFLAKWREECPEELAQKRRDHSDKMLDWHVNNKERYMEIAAERNKKLRTKEHREHMSQKTREFYLSSAGKKCRDKANKTIRNKASIRQSCLKIMHDNLVALEEIKVAPNGVTDNILQGWKKKGLVKKYYPAFPFGGAKTEEWTNFQEKIS